MEINRANYHLASSHIHIWNLELNEVQLSSSHLDAAPVFRHISQDAQSDNIITLSLLHLTPLLQQTMARESNDADCGFIFAICIVSSLRPLAMSFWLWSLPTHCTFQLLALNHCQLQTITRPTQDIIKHEIEQSPNCSNLQIADHAITIIDHNYCNLKFNILNGLQITKHA